MALGSTLRFAILAAGATLLLSCASPPPENLKAWDQAEATSLAEQLAAATQGFYNQVYQDPDAGMVGSGDAQAFTALQDSTRTLIELSQALAGHLKAGEGQPETLNYFRGVKEKADDCAEDAEQAFLAAPVQDSWKQVSGLIVQLAQYYDTRGLDELDDRP